MIENIVNEHIITNKMHDHQFLYLGIEPKEKIIANNIYKFNDINFTKKSYDHAIINCFLEKQNHCDIDSILNVIFLNVKYFIFLNINCDYESTNLSLLHPTAWIEKLQKFKLPDHTVLFHFSLYKDYDILNYDKYNTELTIR